jgi:hypothetical protein
VNASAVTRFLARGVVEGLVFTLLCCMLGTGLIVCNPMEHDRSADHAGAPCPDGESTGIPAAGPVTVPR